MPAFFRVVTAINVGIAIVTAIGTTWLAFAADGYDDSVESCEISLVPIARPGKHSRLAAATSVDPVSPQWGSVDLSQKPWVIGADGVVRLTTD